MTIEEFLRKIVEIDLTQAQHVFHDWDAALENYAIRYKKHGSPNVVRLLKIANSLGELVDLYRGVVLRRYPMTIASLNSKTVRYNELISYYNYKNGQELTLFERISNGSTMEERLNFVYLMSKADALQGETIDRRKILQNLREGKLYDSSNQIWPRACLEPYKS